MSKKIKSNLYMKSKISVKLSLREEDPQGFLFAGGKYRTKILPEDLPEWYLYGYLYKRYGFISTKGVKHLLYVPNYIFDNHLHKDDMLFISYGTEIEPDRTELGFAWYKGYDYVIDGSLILEFVDSAEKFSEYNVHAIRDELSKKQAWYTERNSAR